MANITNTNTGHNVTDGEVGGVEGCLRILVPDALSVTIARR